MIANEIQKFYMPKKIANLTKLRLKWHFLCFSTTRVWFHKKPGFRVFEMGQKTRVSGSGKLGLETLMTGRALRACNAYVIFIYLI